MIRISKKEAKTLVEKGFKWHDDVFRTYTKHPTYFAKESVKVLRAIENLRKCV